MAAALTLAGCGGGGQATPASASGPAGGASTSATGSATVPVPAPPPKPVPPPYPKLLPAALGLPPAHFVPAVLVRGQTAVWIASSASGVGLLSFDQDLVKLVLHAGSVDPGGSGWRWGPAVIGSERRRLVAGFNGGFKFSTGAGGFVSGRRVAVAPTDGLGSIVIYQDGHTDIGAWHHGLPAPGTPVVSVRQNLGLLIDHGAPASNLDCLSCWGATLGGVVDPARSALGITAHGRLIWAGGEHLTVAQLANALLAAKVQRAVQLDINPAWVAGYLYGHRGGHGPLAPVPVAPGQVGVSGFFLVPYSRDFFTLISR
jgi:hypothetical protein